MPPSSILNSSFINLKFPWNVHYIHLSWPLRPNLHLLKLIQKVHFLPFITTQVSFTIFLLAKFFHPQNTLPWSRCWKLLMDTARMLVKLKADCFLLFISFLLIVSDFYQEKLTYNFQDTIWCLMEAKPPDETILPVRSRVAQILTICLCGVGEGCIRQYMILLCRRSLAIRSFYTFCSPWCQGFGSRCEF